MFNKRPMSRRRLVSIVFFSFSFASAQLSASTINETYTGSDDQGYGDVIGELTWFDTYSATITRNGHQLYVSLDTEFAGEAGRYAGLSHNEKGIGYGDLFLSTGWNPYDTGSDAPEYKHDDASNGTIWEYGFSLFDRWSNSGGAGQLYALNSANHTDQLGNVLLSDDFMSSGIYRNGQEVAVDTASNGVVALSTGQWSVNATNQSLLFSINISGTSLVNSDYIALHWGPTCANDVIEGEVMPSPVPVPAAVWLFGSGLAILLGFVRRKQ